MESEKAQRKSKERARNCGPYIHSITQRGKNDEGRNEPSLQNQRLQNGYKEEKDEYYILEIRNGVFMESLQIHSLKKKIHFILHQVLLSTWPACRHSPTLLLTPLTAWGRHAVSVFLSVQWEEAPSQLLSGVSNVIIKCSP